MMHSSYIWYSYSKEKMSHYEYEAQIGRIILADWHHRIARRLSRWAERLEPATSPTPARLERRLL